MAYLTEFFSKQDAGVADKGSLNTNVVVELPAADVVSVVVETAEISEHCNFHIARQLKEEKTKLINGLCQFPMTALWLLNEYDKNAGSDDLDEEVGLSSDQAALFNTIKRSYLLASQELFNNAANDPAYLAAKHNLSIALQQFAFSFEDLTRLVEVIVYAYKYRGLSVQIGRLGSLKQRDVMFRRLEGLDRRNRFAGSKLSDLFKAIELSDYDEQFLFLSSSEMQKHFTDIVLAESRWLSLRQELAATNSRLVLFIANQYKAGFLDFEDIVQEGQTGLLKAVDRFDYRLGFQFSTYAGYWIRQAISRSLSRCERVVRVPCGQVANINRLYRLKDQYTTEAGREPSVQDLAGFAKMEVDDVHAILAISQTSLSIEGSEDGGETAFAPIDFLEQQVFTHAFSGIAQSDLHRLLAEAIETLNPREAQVIRCHFGVGFEDEMTLQEIGSELNLTRERVRQIQVMALNKIKQNFGQQLASFL
jgi:RNA polymerase sigma factor (sigma-70 family)